MRFLLWLGLTLAVLAILSGLMEVFALAIDIKSTVFQQISMRILIGSGAIITIASVGFLLLNNAQKEHSEQMEKQLKEMVRLHFATNRMLAAFEERAKQIETQKNTLENVSDRSPNPPNER